MKPYHDVSAPALDAGVEARLRRLDRDFYVTWSPWVLDFDTRQPVVSKRVTDPVSGDLHLGGPVHDPHYYLWIKNPGGRDGLVGTYKRFGNQQVRSLEASLSRFMSPGEEVRRMQEARDRRDERGKAAFRQQQGDTIKANRSRIHDLVFDNKTGERTRKIASYAGQRDRSTPSQVFTPDSKELGWELPERPA